MRIFKLKKEYNSNSWVVTFHHDKKIVKLRRSDLFEVSKVIKLFTVQKYKIVWED